MPDFIGSKTMAQTETGLNQYMLFVESLSDSGVAYGSIPLHAHLVTSTQQRMSNLFNLVQPLLRCFRALSL